MTVRGAEALGRIAPRAVLATLSVLAGCAEPTAEARADSAQAALGTRDYAAARATCDAALAAPVDARSDVTTFRLERLRLEACAGQGDVDAILATLDRLAAAQDPHADAVFHARIGTQLLDAGHVEGALSVVEAAAGRFPEAAEAFGPLLERLEDRLASNGEDAAMRERLASNPYLGGAR